MTSSDQSGHMQTSETGTMHDQATQWMLRQRAGDMPVAEWEEFTRWLEADPQHAEVYDGLVLADADLDPILDDLKSPSDPSDLGFETPEPANDNPISRFLPWVMASAAAIALAVFVWPTGDPTMLDYSTQPGEMQVVALDDDTTMTLNGDSVVKVAQGAPTVIVEQGEVAFAIDADEPSSLRVRVADMVLTDYGTVFNVVLNDEFASVAVAEGIVAINPDSQPIEVNAGERVEKPIGRSQLIRTQVDVDIVATWREGRLEFDNTPIASVLDQVRRSAGAKISVAPKFSGVRLTGSVRASDNAKDIASDLASFVDGNAVQTETGWMIE
ncbi:MAG: FecR domain-containing protein [Pseudomonadota bacterium]